MKSKTDYAKLILGAIIILALYQVCSQKEKPRQIILCAVCEQHNEIAQNNICKHCEYGRATKNTSGDYEAIWKIGGLNIWSKPGDDPSKQLVTWIEQPGKAFRYIQIKNVGGEEWAEIEYKMKRGWIKHYLLKGIDRP